MMAITKIIPVKVNPKACIDYVINKDKTNEKTLVSCHGCSEKTADTFFKIANAKNTNQRGDQKPNLAYHFIQSFPPGENITPEQAHQIGEKYIKEMTKYAKKPDCLSFRIRREKGNITRSGQKIKTPQKEAKKHR